MSESQDRKRGVSAEELLKTYAKAYNDTDGQATIVDVAEMLGMTPENVYQRMLKIRQELKNQGVDLPPMKRSNLPRKTVKRVDMGKLANIARSIRPVLSSEPVS